MNGASGPIVLRIHCIDHENVIAVAAVDQSDYSSNDAPIQWYSSIGPTNNDANSVGITGPTNNTVQDFDQFGAFCSTTFGGTSCATPNVAGAVAAFWSRHPSLNGDDVSNLIKKKASLFKDWGSSGYDNTFGNGGLFLYSYDPLRQNIYVDTDLGLNGVSPGNFMYPWDNIKDINDQTLLTNPGNVILLTNDPVSAPKLISKKMIIKSASENRLIY